MRVQTRDPCRSANQPAGISTNNFAADSGGIYWAAGDYFVRYISDVPTGRACWGSKDGLTDPSIFSIWPL